MHTGPSPMGYSCSEPHGPSPSTRRCYAAVLTSLYVQERCMVVPGAGSISRQERLLVSLRYPSGM